jgi:cellulose synthase/poly-beta-1,6-N-acetylglucosamine synthase-like glycosyltransferase
VLAGYPVVLALAPQRRWRIADLAPTVTLLVPAHRERELLPAKLRSVANLDYPRDRLQVVVVSDGDAELAKIARAAAPDATVVTLPRRGGKPGALNAGLSVATGDVVLLTDAHSLLEPGALRACVRHFADPAVWAVSGRWGEQGSPYDRYEHMLRSLESRSGSTAGVSGAVLAVRRERLERFPADVVNDDLWLLCRLVRAGGRVVYEPAAQCVEPPLAPASELERRARISAGRAQLTGELVGLPRGFRWRMASHKLGRLVLPFLLLGALAAAFSLARRPRWRALAGLQAAGYATGALAAAGVLPPSRARGPARAAAQFVAGNAGVAAGIGRALRGRQGVLWKAVR